jgi:hypothetical protein
MSDPRFPKTSAFSRAFAAEFKAFMSTHGVRGAQIAEKLDRGEGYVSERVNGKRPLDTDDIDALAGLVDGWTGIDLMIELSRRARIALEGPSGELIQGRFGVGGSTEDREIAEEPAAAKKKSRDRGEEPEAP